MDSFSNLYGVAKTVYPPKTDAQRAREIYEWNLREIDAYNKLEGHLHLQDGIECDVCKNKGFVAWLDPYSHEVVKGPCDCQARRKIQKNKDRSGLDKKSRAFSVKAPFQARMAKAAQIYANNPKGWFVCLGKVGSGKTTICMGVADQLLNKGYRVEHHLWENMVSEYEKSRFAEYDPVDTWANIQVLFIDDFLKYSHRGPALEMAYRLLNTRYNKNMLTIISGEPDMKELESLDEAIASRIKEMTSNGGCLILNDSTSGAKDMRETL